MPIKKELLTDIVLIDIINFSKLTTTQQVEIIKFLTKSYKKVIEKMLNNSNMQLTTLVQGFVPTGDGFYCILHPRFKGYGPILGLSFNHFSEQISKKFPYFHGVRIAVHTGEIHEFNDILGHKNYIGQGMNDCSRYAEFKNFAISTVMVSQSAYAHLKTFLSHHKDFQKLLIEREFKHSELYVFKDKHEQEKRGYHIWLRKSGIIIPPNIKF